MKGKLPPHSARNKQFPKKSSEETRKILFEKSKQKAPLNTKLNQLKNKIQAEKTLRQEQATIKECTHSSSKSSNKFQMSGMLLKSKGEEAAAELKAEDYSEDSLEEAADEYLDMPDRDELGDLLGDEEVD